MRKRDDNRPSFHKDGGLFHYGQEMNGRRFAKCDYRLDRAEPTQEGYLDGIVTVTGCGVFPYRNLADDGSWDGTWRQELRAPEHVHAKDSLDTLKMLPGQVEHVAMLGVDNIDALKVGNLGENYEVGPLPDGLVKIRARIDSPRGLDAIAKGKKELSLGYDLDLVKAPDGASYMGKPYTHIQTNIRYNHFAITDKARLGPQMRLDSADAIEDVDPKPLPQERPMKKYAIDGIEYDAAPEIVVHIGKLKQQAADAAANCQTMKEEMDQKEKDAKKNADSIQAKLDTALADKKKAEDALEAERKDLPNKVAAFAKDAADLMSVATAVMAPADVKKLTGMDSKAIKIAIVKAKYPEANMDGKSDDYIQSRFDSVKEDAKVTGSAANAQNRLDSSELDADDGLGGISMTNADSARAKMIKRNQERYLDPMGKNK